MEEKLDNQNRELRSQVSRLSRGDRIRRIARDQLGMVTQEPESLVVFVSDDLLTAN
jgi:cell division protein FtsL